MKQLANTHKISIVEFHLQNYTMAIKNICMGLGNYSSNLWREIALTSNVQQPELRVSHSTDFTMSFFVLSWVSPLSLSLLVSPAYPDSPLIICLWFYPWVTLLTHESLLLHQVSPLTLHLSSYLESFILLILASYTSLSFYSETFLLVSLL